MTDRFYDKLVEDAAAQLILHGSVDLTILVEVDTNGFDQNAFLRDARKLADEADLII